MNVSLTPELEKMIEKKVESGLYQTASEVVREALRLLDHQEKSREAQLAEIRAKIARGIQQLNSGDSFTEEELSAHLTERRNKRKTG